MVCPGCLRDVPDLIGPEDLLCPDCLGVSAEDLIPSILESLGAFDGERAGMDAYEDGSDALAGARPAEDAWEEDARFLVENLDDIDLIEDDYPPTFQGRPRF